MSQAVRRLAPRPEMELMQGPQERGAGPAPCFSTQRQCSQCWLSAGWGSKMLALHCSATLHHLLCGK